MFRQPSSRYYHINSENRHKGNMLEAQLINKVKQKSRLAQSQLYEKYSRYWYATCLRYFNESQDAADAMQNALVKVFTKIDQFDVEKGSFKAWSSRVMVNECLMLLREKTKDSNTTNLEEGYNQYSHDETAIEKLSAEELTKMVQKLPVGYRTVFNLYVLEGYGHIEISKMLDISVGTSKSQLFKARKMLQKKIEVLI